MRIYLSSRYSRWEEMCQVAAELLWRGHTPVGVWYDGRYDRPDRDTNPELMTEIAKADIEGLKEAELLVFFSEKPRQWNNSRNGRQVEFGYALAKGIPIALIGPRENSFHYLGEDYGIAQFEHWADFVKNGLREDISCEHISGATLISLPGQVIEESVSLPSASS